jgi:hypothetical protein
VRCGAPYCFLRLRYVVALQRSFLISGKRAKAQQRT